MAEVQMDLIVAEQVQANALALFTEPQGMEKVIADIEAKVASFTPDLSTDKGRKAIASLAYKVSQSKVLLDNLGKSLTDDWKKKAGQVDAARKIARDRLDELRDKARQPLTEWEEAEEKRLAAEKLAKEIEEAHAAALVENDLFNRARELAAKEAELARIEAERLAKEEEERKRLEAIAALERQERERKEMEERIRREAEEKARKEAEEAAAAAIREAERKEREAKESAERAERERIAAAERAEADRLAAIKRAEEEKAAAVRAAEERARLEAERIENERKAQERAAAIRLAEEKAEAERKAADVEHRRAVNKEVVAGLVAAGITEKQAQEVVKAIVGGLVKNCQINY